jgi:toluene monooxygenase system protein E
MTPRRTYWHLEGQKRKPSDYDIATSRLLTHPQHGFEVKTPGAAWIARHGLPGDWEHFRDPRETTYSRYVERQHEREIFVDGLFESIERSGSDRRLDPAWVGTLAAFLAPLRYPYHALQMGAAYLGQLAPSGKLVVVLAFQAADEIRRIQRIAYRMRQLQTTHPGFGEGSRDAWQHDPRWQPLRRVVEELLVTWDWAEGFAALCLVVKPLLDELATTALGRAAERAADDALARMLGSLDEDCVWHREWTAAMARLLPGPPLREAVDRWRPRAHAAVRALAPLLREDGEAVIRAHDERLAHLGLEEQ